MGAVALLRASRVQTAMDPISLSGKYRMDAVLLLMLMVVGALPTAAVAAQHSAANFAAEHSTAYNANDANSATAYNADCARALDVLLRDVLHPGTVENVSEQLSDLGVLCVGDLQWATDAELTAMGVKAIPLRKLRHAAAAHSDNGRLGPTVIDPEAELQCLRSGREDCAVQKPSASNVPAEFDAKESSSSDSRMMWDDSIESDLKQLLMSLSSSVAEKLQGDAFTELGTTTPPIHANGHDVEVPDRIEQPSDGLDGDVWTTAAGKKSNHADGNPQVNTTIGSTNISLTNGLYPGIEAALEAARHGSTAAPLPTRLVNGRRERLAFATVSEASVLMEAGRLRAALQLQRDALLIDDSAAAAHYNNIGVTHARLHEMKHAAEALERALVAAAAGSEQWSQVRAGATQATILSNKWRLQQLEAIPVKERSMAPGRTLHKPLSRLQLNSCETALISRLWICQAHLHLLTACTSLQLAQVMDFSTFHRSIPRSG